MRTGVVQPQSERSAPMRALPLGLVLTTLAFVGCDTAQRDASLAADTLTTTSSRIMTSDVASGRTEAAPVEHVAPVRRSTPVRHTARTSHASTTHVYAQPVPVVHRHTKRDAAIGAGVGATVGAITHGVKGGIVGGV